MLTPVTSFAGQFKWVFPDTGQDPDFGFVSSKRKSWAQIRPLTACLLQKPSNLFMTHQQRWNTVCSIWWGGGCYHGVDTDWLGELSPFLKSGFGLKDYGWELGAVLSILDGMVRCKELSSLAVPSLFRGARMSLYQLWIKVYICLTVVLEID